MEFQPDLFDNLEWDPVYLSQLFEEDFNNFDDLWNFEICTDQDLVEWHKW